jgi:integrase
VRRGPRWQLSLDPELGRHIGSKTEAEVEAATIRAAILAGTFERAADRLAREPRQTACGLATSAGIALDVFARIYVDRASKPTGKVSWAKDAMFDRFCAYRSTDERALGQWPLPSITEDVIEAFFASLSDFAASTRNKYVQLLKASFRWAVKKGYLAHSPISDDSALKRTKAALRRRRISLEEERALLDAASPARMGPDPLKHGAGLRLQWLIIAAIETGCRLGELLALQWGDVDWSKRTVLVRAVERGAKKTGRSRLLPMSARLSATLDMAKTDPAGRQYPPAAYVLASLVPGSARSKRPGRPACCAPTATNRSGRNGPTGSLRNPARLFVPSICIFMISGTRQAVAGLPDLDLPARGREGVAGIDAAVRRGTC